VPSHRVHRIIGERICEYSNPVIDELIDGYIGIEELNETVKSSRTLHLDLFGESPQEEKHDAARTSCSDLFKQVEAIYSRFGDKGICYYILHHYLDKLPNILMGQLLHRLGLSHYNDPELIISEFLPRLEIYMKEGYEAEVSVFSVLETIVEKGAKDYDSLYKHLPRELDNYYRNTRHRKRRLFREIWSDCMNSFFPERMQLAKLIVLKSREVRRSIAQNAKWIMCTLMEYEPKKFKTTPRLLDVLRAHCTQSSSGLFHL
jgi:hypothetical protein